MTDPEAPTRRPQKRIVSDALADEAKRSIIFGAGYQRPPHSARFKKGQSGNPKGRPKRLPPTSSNLPSTNDLVISTAKKLVTVREGTETRKISAIEAVHQAQYATATKGNAYAQKHIIERYDRTERERRAEITEEVVFWERYVSEQRQAIADAIAKRETPPEPLPHPDDIVIDHLNGVRFTGPVNKQQAADLKETLQLRDLLIMQDVWDRRSGAFQVSADSMNGPGSSCAIAQALNAIVPKRLRLSDQNFILQMMRFEGMPKRILLKELYRAWKDYGMPFHRGFIFPPLRRAKEAADLIHESLNAS